MSSNVTHLLNITTGYYLYSLIPTIIGFFKNQLPIHTEGAYFFQYSYELIKMKNVCSFRSNNDTSTWVA